MSLKEQREEAKRKAAHIPARTDFKDSYSAVKWFNEKRDSLSREESNAWVFGPEGKKVREKIDELQKAEAKQKRADTKRDHAGDAARSGLKSGDKVYQQGSNLFGIYRIAGTLVPEGRHSGRQTG